MKHQGEKDHQGYQVGEQALNAARLENWFVGLLGHVSLLLPHNMRHALGVVNGNE